jgi:hypothetical protein
MHDSHSIHLARDPSTIKRCNAAPFWKTSGSLRLPTSL